MNVKIHMYGSAVKMSLYIAISTIVLSAYCPGVTAAEYSFLRAKHSGKCLHQHGATQGNGDPITQWDCVDQPNVKLEIIPQAGGGVFLKFAHSGKCVHVYGNSTENGAPITQWDCIDQGNVKWNMEPAGEGYFYIKNASTHKCLHQQGATQGNGDPITQWDCVNQPNVQWKIEPTAMRPNFVTLVLDDAGWSDLGVFGGEIPTPNIDALAKSGITLTNFYTGSACMITRAMLYTGKDYHDVGMGNVLGWNLRPEQKDKPAYAGYLLKTALPFPELLQKNGYHTMMTGKWDMGSTPDLDPHSRGFTETRAVLLPSGDTHFSQPDGTMISTRPRPLPYLYSENGEKLEKFRYEFYSTNYYTDMALEMLDSRDKTKPFYLNVTYIAPHTPWQAPAEVTAKYLSTYAKGWDVLRQERFKRQQELGLMRKDAKLPPRPADVPAWDSLSAEQQKIEAKEMAIYAAMIDILDQNVARLIQHLRKIGEYENTVIFLFSDNGAAYGIEAKAMVTRWKYIEENFDNSYENLGNRNSFEGASLGWAMLSNTPWTNYKGDLYEGGIHLPALVHYPRSIVSRIRTDRILSVMDIAPTILEMAGIAYPDTYNGQANAPMNGVSMAGLFNGKVAYDPERWIAWELNGAKGVRKGDWKISERWLESTQCWGARPAGDPPGLFNLATDPFEYDDLAAQKPEKYKELLDLYDRFAKANNVIEVSGCMPQ